jgi:hypothetical protein
MALIGLLSVGLALTRNPRYMTAAGMSYWLIGPVMFVHGYARGRRRKRLERELARVDAHALPAAADS